MLSVTRITATRTLASLSSRAFVASGVHRNFSLAKDLTRKVSFAAGLGDD